MATKVLPLKLSQKEARRLAKLRKYPGTRGSHCSFLLRLLDGLIARNDELVLAIAGKTSSCENCGVMADEMNALMAAVHEVAYAILRVEKLTGGPVRIREETAKGDRR